MIMSLLPRLTAEHFTSGEHLAALQGCTRAAISKQIAQLLELGVLIEARPRHGYRYRYPYRWWTAEDAVALAQRLDIGATWLPEVDSTSEWLRRHQTEDVALQLAFTDFQQAGKGRRGRTWLSPPGRQFILSAGCRSLHAPGRWLGVALAIGVSVAMVLREAGWPVSLKWPNDLMLGDAKLGGILVEMDALAEGPSHVIVGLGLNEALLDEERQGLERAVAALHDEKRSYRREALLEEMVRAICNVLRTYPARGLAGYRDLWQQLDCLQGRQVRFQQAGDLHEGIADGIDEQGSLRVHTPSGVVACHSGEVVWQ